MVQLNTNSIVGRIDFVDQMSFNGLIGTECNLITNMDVPGIMIHKDAKTMKHILIISASL